MKQTIFGMILGVLVVLVVYVGLEMKERYQVVTASEYQVSTAFTVDIDGIRYRD